MSGQSFPVGRITLSDRAAAGISEDLSGPQIELVLPGFGEIMWVKLSEKNPAAIL
jgi:molybdopterin biosynthesis enzyme MoaB